MDGEKIKIEVEIPVGYDLVINGTDCKLVPKSRLPKTWDEFESYVHSHGDILKLFSEDGSHFEVPVGAWIVKTPDGYNVPSVARFIPAKQKQPEVDVEKEYKTWWNSISGKINIEHTMEWYMHKTARHFAEWGAVHLNARKEE